MTMHRPILVTPPASPPITAEDARKHCRIDSAEEDTLLSGFIAAAVEHLDGYAGILGRCIMSQSWRQDFDNFNRVLRLPLPVNAVTSITWTSASGQISTVNQNCYTLQQDARGSLVRFKDGFEQPSDLYQTKAVAVTFAAGASTAADVPAPIRTAILLMVAHWYAHREDAAADTLTSIPLGAVALLTPLRRIGL
jgi:phage conserved hypothetical protein, phiE125 gp8 family